MSQDEVRRGLHRRVLLTRKADPFFTIGFAVCMGAGFGILYRVIVSSTIANHPSHVVTGVLLMVMGIVMENSSSFQKRAPPVTRWRFSFSKSSAS
jgi:ABC-type uncharacterized transport system permease subunit